MRKSIYKYVLCGLCLSFSVTSTDVSAAKIEAVKGKNYRLTKQHGPWMIMVASLKSIPGRTPTAEEGASQLVYELRRKGIPAYVYEQQKSRDEIETVDRVGRPRVRSYTAQDDRVCVIAGNYKSVDDTVGQKTLAYIKRLRPTSWGNQQNYKSTPGQPGPLSGAFMTINPLLSPDEVASRKQDPLLARLNSGSDMSLLENKAKYSLVVASFYGTSVTQIGFAKSQRLGTLDEAAEEAWQLAKMLRARNFDAYVLHERYRSVVTVGSYNSNDDPDIARKYERFRAKVKRDAQTGKESLVAESFAAPLNRNGSLKTWVFDPKPELIQIPRIRR